MDRMHSLEKLTEMINASDSMTEKEKTVFLYGYWDNSFYDKAKKNQLISIIIR